MKFLDIKNFDIWPATGLRKDISPIPYDEEGLAQNARTP